MVNQEKEIKNLVNQRKMTIHNRRKLIVRIRKNFNYYLEIKIDTTNVL